MALDTLASLAGGARALAQAELLARSEALFHLRCEDAGPRLLGHWRGSGATPYRITVELGCSPTRHTCTCPSRQRPCKHVLALLARWARAPEGFARHGQLDAFAGVRVTGKPAGVQGTLSPPPGPLPAGNAGRAASIRRHRERQALGLQLAESLLVRWVTEGLCQLDPATLRADVDRLEHLEGLQLAGVAGQLRTAAHAALSPVGEVEARDAALAVQLGRAWTLIQRGLAWAGSRPPESLPSPSDAVRDRALQEEAALQTALGRRWTPGELRLLGAPQKHTLVELAWRRSEAPGLRARVESSFLYDLEGAGWMEERKVTPWTRLGHARPKASYVEPLVVHEAQRWPVSAEGPDAACPRVRWSPGAAQSRPAAPSDWARLREGARPLAAILARHATLRAAPWHVPVVHPELLQLQAVEHAESALWVRDPQGDRYRLHGPPEALTTLRCLGLPSDAETAVVEVGEGVSPEAPTLSLLALITPSGPVRLAG